jgi:hypothetical protein
MAKVIITNDRNLDSVEVDGKLLPCDEPVETNKDVVAEIEKLPGFEVKDSKAKDAAKPDEADPAKRDNQGEGNAGHAGGEAPPAPTP